MKAFLFKITVSVFTVLLLLLAPKLLISNNLEAPETTKESRPPCPAGEVEVIFTLDMTCSGTAMRPPVVTGPFNGFSGDGNVMIDPDGDDIWEAIICAVPGSSFEYKYAILNFVEQENLVDDAIGGAPCSYNTNFFDFSNRLVTIPAGGGALPIDTYGICGTCDNPPVNVTFTVNMNCSDVAPGTQIAMFGGFNGFCCPYNLNDPDGDNVWTTTLPFPPDENGCITMEYLYMAPNFSNVESFLNNGEDLANCPNINTDFYNFANRIITVCADTVLDDYWNTCFAPEEPADGCDDGDCDNGVENWDGCECITTTAIAGCTDSAACNFDPNASCNDGTCDFGNAACPDPCNEPDPDDGCDLTVDNFDPSTCTVTNIALCGFGTEFNPATCTCDDVLNFGCTDPCADNFDPIADTDDGSCNPYDMTCNMDCTVGPFGGTWDMATCGCINETTPVLGCTDAAFCEFDPAANCDDGSCTTLNTDPGNCDDADCSTIDSFDNATCSCVNTPDPNLPLDCDDLDCATIDTYNASTCSCENIPDPNLPLDCDDLECATIDTYNAATCSCENIPDPNLPLVCDDGDCATIDTYDETICSCSNTPDPNLPLECNDLDCSTIDTYDDATCSCSNMPDPNLPLDCDDGDCNTEDSYDDTTCSCVNTTITVDPNDGCEFTDDSYDPATCTVSNVSNCPEGSTLNIADCTCSDIVIDGCTDPCDPAYTPDATNDVLCEGYDMTCNTDCTFGDIEIWDTATCSCILDIPSIPGCTNATACNFNPNANCDDGTCLSAPVCNTDICAGDTEIIDPNDACSCIVDQFQVIGCTDPIAVNYDPAANCDDGSCFEVCEDEIAGTINTDMACDVSGTAVLITDTAGNPIGMAIAGANGNYSLPGVYPCGEYIATLDVASIPACYTNAGGETGPSGFVINGDGQADGANFSSFNEVPTLSQWGLIVLALLLMTFGALKLGLPHLTVRRKLT